MRRNLVKRLIFIFSIISVISFIGGCGKKDKQLENYYEKMNSFASEVLSIKESMDGLDLESTNFSTDMLTYLDAMELQFGVLAEIEVPKQFAGNETLADEAYSHMQEAVRLYHEFYEAEDSNRNLFDMAQEHYSRAMKRIEYISLILKGETPEGDGIEVFDEESTDFNPVTEE